MAQEPKYEDRYCAYVDILAFKALVAELRAVPSRLETIRTLLKKIRDPYDERYIGFGDTDLRVQSISDAVAFSVRPTPQGFSVLCAALRELSLALLHEGYFTRGAVCKGLLYHDESMVFGEALIKAYRLESEVVRFPRIMLTKDIVDEATASESKDDLVERIKQATDGPYFLHILWRLGMLLDVRRERPADASEPDPSLSYYTNMRDKLQLRLDESIDTPKHFEKVQWFANYLNNTVGAEDGLMKRIKGAGLFQMGFLGE